MTEFCYLQITAIYRWHPGQLMTVNWRWKMEGIGTHRFLCIRIYVVYLGTLLAAQSLRGKNWGRLLDKEMDRTWDIQYFPNMSFCPGMFL